MPYPSGRVKPDRVTGRCGSGQGRNAPVPDRWSPPNPLYGPIRMNKDSDSGRVAGDDDAS